ncbi:uncharacterized protein LOC8077197 [Sorghum bicolor]|uniref:DUF632 domain-containing protein n=1 Tax=Sorghum bicolor TaxID=4558 RepID=C5XW72_SORBI|nr:uncharacterized protein LOC8077197 [Sorghum bicolor]EES06355.1 hypothetical protein SORBI_3004G060000 [Sorghum bicolor]|eukprot:XP_002453379.1 uncharacterized protein LOC8077197 [Sorghum bicolor]
MGCSSSKLDEEAAVKTCHDRKSFVKKAIAQRDLLASSHVAYVQSLRRVSMALVYYFAEDEHLYRLQEASYVHYPGSPEKVLVVNCLRPAGAPVHPVVEQWEPPEAIEAATIDRFFGTDMNSTPVSPQPPRWDLFWDPFSSLADHPNYGVEEVKGDQEDEQIPELEEESDDDDGGGGGEGEAEEVEEKGEPAAVAAPVVPPPPAREKVGRKVDHVKNELRVLATAEVEQHNGAPGFTVYVDRPPTSMGEAMDDIQGHFRKILDTAKEVSVLLEVVPYQRRVQPPVPRDDGEEQGAPEVPPEPFELFQSHKESLDRLYEWEKRLYEEVRAGEKVRLAYEKKCALLRSQDANGAEPIAIEKTRVVVRDLRTKLDISLTSVDAVSRRIAAVRDDELLPQLMQLVRGLARMWRVIADAHRVMKRTADDSIALLTSSAAAAEAARPVPTGEGGTRGPPPPPGAARAAAGAGALGSELRGWRAALEAWAESQRAYAAALWGWARSCVKDGEDMPRLIVGWARAVDSVDVEPATRAVDAVAAEAAAVASAAKRQRGGGEEWFNEEEGKKKVCVALAAALGAIAEAGGLAVFGYDELLLEMEMGAREREREIAGRDEESIQN